ncbi:calcium voltage-gated channel subunit alpha1 A [Homo sapiens]|uniref:Calcium voltage-gated channel subunit alpha1 A n=1 Tax=Homo sapiens TaxID=9606 RepID=K7EIF8_HUMAN|nr:calcium voltage-gated channel subunit alpha1 A [Homo sapiens]KAI4040841.1 calcium voltage-gated channel subunit alpha1 A [Homo sapiens]
MTPCTTAARGTPSALQDTRPPRLSICFEGPPLRRRGGVVDHRDVILAHQAHKIHSTPQARRKEWEKLPEDVLHPNKGVNQEEGNREHWT